MSVKGSSGNLVISIDDFIASNTRDDKKRDEGLTTPSDIERFDDIRYGENERNVLDVYRPKDCEGKLPVIVSVHGGGWVYGNKSINQFYCMSLAQKGFAVVNFSYRLSPEYKHPTPLIDTNKVFKWVIENADAYEFDTDNVFAVGDSVGANIVGFFCCLCLDNEYAKKLSVKPPKDFVPKALGLNCGLYCLERGKEPLLDNLAAEYFPKGGTDEEYGEIDLKKHIKSTFPPSFIATASEDFLRSQAKPFYEFLKSLGVETEYRCYGDEKNVLTHVFHINIKLDGARECNADECEFFKKHIERHKGKDLK